MINYTVSKRQNKKSFSWMYDIKHPSFKNGKERKAGFKTKSEANAAALEIIRQLQDGQLVRNEKTFEAYYIDWLEIKNKKTVAEKQYYWYERSLKLFKEYFGNNMLVKNIKRSEYQKFLNQYGKGRSTETVRKVHGCISPCLRDAVYDGYLSKDPTYQIDVKGTKKPKSEEAKYMTIEQYEGMLAYFKTREEMSYVFLYLMAITGARFSDMINMTLADLNKAPGIIHLPGTKTSNSPRDVEVSQKDITALNTKIAQLPRHIDGRLFHLSHTAVKKAFNHTKKQINLNDEKITPYALRHTHTSYLLSKGIPIEYISKRLGHSTISITLDIYTHLLDEHKKEQGQKVREIFS
ncbi:site-specific integrase [Macrococcus hajekii]|uniref:Site-specific integrase n=1 Tax=Macrococcus hajekii TaxID=198482 RepID=A0A4R6BIN4_9STAP|nr:site-specific integrase [Macrococcus hajekii]TDM01440.1 site-specific integrase [Macrococcus hajekii]GGB00017.1 site-specific integrase [Macrococcus hajekii]